MSRMKHSGFPGFLFLSIAGLILLGSCDMLTLPFATDFNNPVDPGRRDGAPKVPANVAATPADAQVTVTWTASADASSYKVFYKAGATASMADAEVPAAMISGAAATVTGLKNGQQYAFVVVASNAAGNSAPSGVVTATPRSAVAAPVAPSGLTATPGDSQVILAWKAVPDATGYKVFYKVGTVATPADIAVPATMVSGTGATVTGLANGTEYAFVVLAVNAGGVSALLRVMPRSWFRGAPWPARLPTRCFTRPGPP
jgi:cellulose 1,4-beta-cellobiosidase